MKSDSVFLQYNHHIVTYGELERIARKQFSNRQALTDIQVIHAEPRLDAIIRIASCWLMHVPFSVVPVGVDAVEAQLKLRKALDNSTPGQEDELFAILFTSGTTAEPKMVPLSRNNMLAASAAAKQNYLLLPGEKWIHTLPLNHIGGISVVIRAILGGYGIHLIDRFHHEIVRNILSSDHSCTGISLVPTQLRRLLTDIQIRVHPQFKGVLLGGGPVQAVDIALCKDIQLPVTPSFGMTETTAQCLATPLKEWESAPTGTCGIPMAGVEAELRDDSIDPSSTLLWVRGPQIFNGYINQDNSQVFDDDGWFCTGDYATKDEKGYFYIQMRRSDRIVTGGENVNPIEVEHHLHDFHELDGDVVVVGLPNETWGQAVTLVTTQKNHPDIEKVRAFLSSRIEGFKIPKAIRYIPEIPKTAAGKPMRNKLVELLLT